MVFRNPEFLFLLILLPVLAWVWWLRRGRISEITLLLRLLSVTLIICALANPIRSQPALLNEPLVVLLDQSDSLGAAGKSALREQANTLLAQYTGNKHLITFGANSVAEPTNTTLRSDQTDIASAVRVARGLLNGNGGRIILLSDGEQTRGDVLATARSLGIPIDTLAFIPAKRPEIWLERVEVPRTLRSNEFYPIKMVVGSNNATTAHLTLLANAQTLETQTVTLNVGENTFTYNTSAGAPGIVQLEARISGEPDTFTQNNRAAATALIAPQPQVLLVASQSNSALTLNAALAANGISAQVENASDFPSQLSELDDYAGIVLLDVPASDFSLDQMATLREFVRSEGRGLLATGGRSSFTLGAYKDTPLEEVLPVEMTPPPRPQRPPVALLLIVDHSFSMGGNANDISKLDMAKQSALLATRSLHEQDRIGVLAFDEHQSWIVNFQMLGSGLSLSDIQERIGMIGLGGSTDICAALDIGLSALVQQPGQVRHAVIMTDGQSNHSDLCAPYSELIERARAQKITLSTIAIGSDADTELLQQLAQLGAGRYYFAAHPADIPRLTLIESQIASTEPEIEGDFRANLQAMHPLLRDFTPNQIPKLTGYVGTTIKPEAELVLKSPENDPVLATWQYGLGRAVAWTASVDTPWADAWVNWPDYGKFWAQIIRYTLPEPDGGPLQVHATANDNVVTISADALAPGGAPIDLAEASATITLPDGSRKSIPLHQTAPGRYTEDVVLPVSGPYAISVQEHKGDTQRETQIGYVQAPSTEYMPTPGGPELLAQLSAITNGQVLQNAINVFTATHNSRPDINGLWPWFLLAAALIWPLEIAVRRGWLRLR